MLEVLVSAMLTWVSVFTGFVSTSERPTILLKPHSYFVQRACNNVETKLTPCDTIGLYVYFERTIYIDDSLNKEAFEATLIHELTHYLQHVNAMWVENTCVNKILRERQAYNAQQRYITEVQKRDYIINKPSDEEVCMFN